MEEVKAFFTNGKKSFQFICLTRDFHFATAIIIYTVKLFTGSLTYTNLLSGIYSSAQRSLCIQNLLNFLRQIYVCFFLWKKNIWPLTKCVVVKTLINDYINLHRSFLLFFKRLRALLSNLPFNIRSSGYFFLLRLANYRSLSVSYIILNYLL